MSSIAMRNLSSVHKKLLQAHVIAPTAVLTSDRILKKKQPHEIHQPKSGTA